MRFLLTNDDGVDAPGLLAMARAVQDIPGSHFVVIAPATEQSQCGHRVTTGTALQVEKRDENVYAVRGTPADCVRIGLHALGIMPNWVISGVNKGGNMGQDLVISGTVAACREAAYHGVKAMAFSQYVKRTLEIDWDLVSEWVRCLVEERLAEPLEAGSYWNTNLPHLPPEVTERPESVHCVPARSPLPVSFARSEEKRGAHINEYLYDGFYADRLQDPGSDVEVCFGGRVAVSRLSI